MLKKVLLLQIVLMAIRCSGQFAVNEVPAEAIGGKEHIEEILQTQLTLPKILLTSQFDAHINAYFDLDSAGNAINVGFREGLNNALRKEFTRILRFIKFRKTQDEAFEAYPYALSFHISTDRYNKFFKQKSKFAIKKPLPADSSYIVYAKSERSPEYYKNGEEGLEQYILSEMEYPKLAIEKSVEGTVIIEFIVETNGYVTGTTVKQSVGGGCSDEALRIIKTTKWIPAILNGKYVRYKTTYPITFSLRNISHENASSSQTIGQ
jgi:TonB family protein